jgi:hypothetical protein
MRCISMRLCAGFLLAGSVASASIQSVPKLSSLTVPETALPAGCRLGTPPPASGSAPGGAAVYPGEFSFFPTNPWIGLERELVVLIRTSIDGAPRLPDGPPLPPPQARALEQQLGDHVSEAYRALYQAAVGSPVEVRALTFDGPMLARPESLSMTMNPPRGFRSRSVRGATVVVVTASADTDCARAIDAHVRALK